MNKEQAQIKIQQLSDELRYHNRLYYDQSTQEISDYNYDQMMYELIDLERAFPELKQADSPSERVGGSITKDFTQVVHQYPMLSLGNTYSRGELLEFDQRVKKVLGDIEVEYVCEL